MVRTPAGPVLTPHTAQQLINTFSNPWTSTPDPREVDMSSQSPGSMYSEEASPGCPGISAFEYDDIDMEHLEIDTTEYEALMDQDQDPEQGGEDDPSSPAWGRWPNQSVLGRPGWTPLPTHSSFRSESIISISPRGSLSTSTVRRGSLPNRKFSDTTRRRSSLSVPSTDHIYQNMVRDRRHSSTRSQVSSRRRSSVMSNGTTLDPIEEDRWRNLARIGILARRFSELVEVIAPSPGEDEAMNDVNYARELISHWSPYSTETDVSEIRTAPHAPTPQLAPAAPTIWSNYPLPSSVAQEVSLNTPDMDDRAISPVFALRLPRMPIENTPSPVREPVDQLRQRARPGIVRASTDYVFPNSLPVEPYEPALRPIPRRAISTPQLSMAPPIDSELAEPFTATLPENTPPKKYAPATGSFPLARSHPLGLSKLRSSSRRISIPTDLRAESPRASSVAERRISIVQQGSRRPSTTNKPPNGASFGTSRRSSLEPLQGGMLQVPPKASYGSDLRRESLDPTRRISSTSRKSSTLSLGEYTYLASEIDQTLPALPMVEHQSPQRSKNKSDSLSSRRNGPPSIVLPTYNFPIPGPLATSSSATPRYSPLDSFFGRTPSLSSSCSTNVDPLSPWLPMDLPSPKAPGLHRSVIDRGRPISSPEFHDAFPSREDHAGAHAKSRGSHKASAAVPNSEIALPRSPSYRFPITSPGLERKVKLAPSPMPLKSILVHRSSDIRVDAPVKHQRFGSPTFESRKDQHLLSELDSPPPGTGDVGGERRRPAIKHQSSFTRLFHRDKSQSPTFNSLAK